MGFFSSKVTCAVCHQECGLNRFQLKDKLWVCPSCFKAAGFGALTPIKTMTPSDVECAIGKRQQDRFGLDTFHVTKSVPALLMIDEDSKRWYTPAGAGGKKHPHIFNFSDIVDYELMEDGNTITKGGLGRAVAGGFLFGGVGAVVGGATGSKHSKSTCTSLKIKVTINDLSFPTEYINLIQSELKKDSIIYRTLAKQAEECVSLLQIICESKEKSGNICCEQAQSSADEIMKFKQLLDAGAITQDEFDVKKKQLLGL